jgi:integrase/recombinase XerC
VNQAHASTALNNRITEEPPIPWRWLWQEFELHLRAGNRSKNTVGTYKVAFDKLIRFLEAEGFEGDATNIRAPMLRRFLAQIGEESSPATANHHYRALRRFFGWLKDDAEERDDNPMEKVEPPKIPERIIPALRMEQIQSVLRACDTTTPIGRRDYAIITVLLDTGLRASEFLTMQIDPEGAYEHVTVMGKGSKERTVRLGMNAKAAVLRYIRTWRLPRPYLWVNHARRPLTRSGLLQIFERLRERTGIHLFPHLRRHTFATLMLEAKAPQEVVRTLLGHETDVMLRRYTRSREIERALEAHRQFSPADRLK